MPPISDPTERQQFLDARMTIVHDSLEGESEHTNVSWKIQRSEIKTEASHFPSETQVPDEAVLNAIESGQDGGGRVTDSTILIFN